MKQEHSLSNELVQFFTVIGQPLPVETKLEETEPSHPIVEQSMDMLLALALQGRPLRNAYMSAVAFWVWLARMKENSKPHALPDAEAHAVTKDSLPDAEEAEKIAVQ